MKWVRKYIGSHLVELNGDLDALGCTAGVGEGDKLFGPLVTDGLPSLGIDVDPTKLAPNEFQHVSHESDGGAHAGVLDR